MSGPLVAVTSIVKFPGEALEPAIIVKIDVAVAFEAGITGEPIDVVMFAGALPSHEAVSVTGELKPFIGLIIIVTDLLASRDNAKVEMEEEIEKSGVMVLLLLVEV